MWDYYTWMKMDRGIVTKASVKVKPSRITSLCVCLSDFRNMTDSHRLSPKHLPLSCASQKLPPGKQVEAVGVYYLSCVNFNGLMHFIKI